MAPSSSSRILSALLAHRPNRLPFALKAMALFLLVRAVFVSLTHIAPSPIDPVKPAPFLNAIFFGSDQFFSGHTGLPLLAALTFWHMPFWRYFYLASTLFFGAIVLLGHYHYSIDVLAALFITYGIFQIACWSFKADLALFRSSEATPRVPKKAIRKKIAKWAEGAKAARKKKPPLVPEVIPEPAAQPFRLHVVEDTTPSPDSGRLA